MSVYCRTYCLDCLVIAPEIGDGGFIGNPDMNSAKNTDSDEEMENFGYIYEGLAALQILTDDVEAYKSFLKVHQGHRVIISSDHDEEHPKELQGEMYDKLTDFEFTDDDFEEGHYVISCVTCGTEFFSTDSEKVRIFTPFKPTRNQINTFLSHTVEIDDVNFHRPSSLIHPFEDLEEIAAFLEEHEGHDLLISLKKQLQD
jgi:hypothetical protein